MKKILIAVFLGMATAVLSSCGLFKDQSDGQDNQGAFEIYLLSADFVGEENDEDQVCANKEELILSNSDIQSYDLESHEIRLNQAAFERLSPMQLAGKPFVVCANQDPIYTGEFMALFMSRSSEGVVILWPPMEEDAPIMQIQLGYPGPDFYTGEDPRSDKRILKALEQAGLLDEDLEPTVNLDL